MNKTVVLGLALIVAAVVATLYFKLWPFQMAYQIHKLEQRVQKLEEQAVQVPDTPDSGLYYNNIWGSGARGSFPTDE